MTFLPILLLGFFLGMRHATDADHVVAVSTIVSRERDLRGAALTGVFWGVGHSLTVCVVGGAIMLFGLVVPERLGLGLEFSVALMLIALGLVNLAPIFRQFRGGAEAHEHVHSHGDYIHTHPHSHGCETHGHGHKTTPTDWFDTRFHGLKLYQAIRPLIVGIVHGLAGSAAVALLVLPIIRNPVWSMSYLLVFSLGTIIGMMLITLAIALPFLYANSRSHTVHRWLGLTTSLVSIAFGGFLVYQISFV